MEYVVLLLDALAVRVYRRVILVPFQRFLDIQPYSYCGQHGYDNKPGAERTVGCEYDGAQAEYGR